MKKIIKVILFFLLVTCAVVPARAIILVRAPEPFIPYAERQQVAFVGDSLTVGNGAATRGGYRYDLMALLTEFHDGVPVNVVGADYPSQYSYGLIGAAGITSTLLKTNYVEPQLAAVPSVTMAQAPEVVFLLIGTNDFLTGAAKATWLANVTSIIASFQLANSDCVVIVGNLIDRETYTATVIDWNASLLSTIEALPGYEENIFIADLYSELGPYDGARYADQTHPNAAGYLLLAQAWYDTYETIF